MNKILKAKVIEHFGTQFQFAKALGDHEAIVSLVIRGKLNLSPEARRRWADLLKIKNPEKYFRPGDGD